MNLWHKIITHCLTITLVAAGLFAVALPRAQAQDVYWTTNGAVIMGSDLAGENVVEVFDGAGAAGSAVDVAVTATHIYWTDKNDTAAGGVWRAARDGAGAALFISNPGSANWAPQFIAIDEANDRLYFSCYFTGLYSATLSTGGDVTSLGAPSDGTTTGLAVRGSNELISVDATGSRQSLYSTNISEKTHGEIISWLLGDGGYHGLAYDPATDTAYYTDFGGTLYLYNLTTDANEALLTGLGQPLGIELSASKSHLLYVERTGGTISAYDLADPSKSFTLVAGGGAFFGVGIDGDPVAPTPAPPVNLPLVETFNGGTPGESIVDQPTSDGKAIWRLTVLSPGASAQYGGEPGNVTFEPFADNERADVYLDADVDHIEEYIIHFDDILLRGGRGDVNGIHNLATFVAFGARKTDGSDAGTYHFRQWHDKNEAEGTYEFRYGIHYVDPGGQNHISPGNWSAQRVPLADVEAGDYSGSELLRSGLALHVRGSEQRLLMDGNPVGAGEWFPTQGTFGDEGADLALVINSRATEHAETLTNPVFNGFSIELPPQPGVPPFKRLYVEESFSYPGGDLVGQNGGTGWAEPWVQSTEGGTEQPLAQVVSPGQAFGDLEVAGNQAAMADGRRGFRAIDVQGLYSGAEEQPPSESIGWPDSSVWISLIVEGAAAPSDPFWGIALFNGANEKLFFGKASGGSGLRLSAQGGAQQFGDAITVDDKHFIAIRIDFDPVNGDSATLFHNPDPMGRTPADDDALGVYTGSGFDMAFNRVRLANGGGPGGKVDELRIGATWNDVTPVPYTGFVNGDFEDEPFTRGWSHVQHITSHGGIAPASTTAAYVTNDTSGPSAWPLLAQHRPNKLAFDTIPYEDPVTGEPLAGLQPTGPEWQVGFYATVADAGGTNDRSLNVGIGHERPADYTGDLQPAINFRISGDGEGFAFKTGAGWQQVFAAGTFAPSVVTDGEFLDPTVYYVEFNGNYSTEDPHFTVSAWRIEGGEPVHVATSDTMRAFQYRDPPAGAGILTVRFNGAVQAPYVVDDVHMITVGDVPAGFAAWQEENFPGETDQSIIGPNADPDGDGLPNVLEYALGSDPQVAGVADLPVHGTIEVSGEAYLTLTFDRPIGLEDVVYEVRASGDLATWSPAVLIGTTDNGDGTEEVVYRHPDPISGSSRGFLALDASLN